MKERAKSTKRRGARQVLSVLAVGAAALLALGCACEKKVSADQGSKDGKKDRPPYSKIECGTTPAMISSSPVAKWVGYPGGLRSLYKELHSNRANPPETPKVDFENHGVLLVYAGRFNQAGYSMFIHDWELKDEVLTLRVKIDPGMEDGFRAQVITMPYCLLEVDTRKVKTIKLDSDLEFPVNVISTKKKKMASPKAKVEPDE